MQDSIYDFDRLEIEQKIEYQTENDMLLLVSLSGDTFGFQLQTGDKVIMTRFNRRVKYFVSYIKYFLNNRRFKAQLIFIEYL